MKLLPQDLTPEQTAEIIRKNPAAYGDTLMRGWLEFFKAHAPGPAAGSR